jgi:hypothetical protein
MKWAWSYQTHANGEVGVIDAGMALDLQRGLLQPVAAQHPLDRNPDVAPEYSLLMVPIDRSRTPSCLRSAPRRRAWALLVSRFSRRHARAAKSADRKIMSTKFAGSAHSSANANAGGNQSNNNTSNNSSSNSCSNKGNDCHNKVG